jgi:hypothetical protein
MIIIEASGLGRCYGGIAHRADRRTPGRAERTIKGTLLRDDRFLRHHYAVPRFWPFQLIEAGWLLMVAVPLPAATV